MSPKPRAKATTAPSAPSAPGLMYPGTTMLHLFEHWKLDQSRPRTVGAVQRTVMQFRALHGPLPVETITRQHARAYRDTSRTYLRREQKQYPFTKLVAAIRLLRHDELRLAHLAVDDPMAGVEECLLT